MLLNSFREYLRGLRLGVLPRKRAPKTLSAIEALETRQLLTLDVSLLKDLSPGHSTPNNLVALDDALLFVATDGSADRQLWKTDGTANGTVMVKDLNAAGNANPTQLTRLDSIVFFTADDGTHGVELWKTDGTTNGTVLVKDINAGGSATPSNLTVVNGLLYFNANDGVNGRELWKSDGTSAGTVLVANINPGADSDPDNLTDVNGTLFFIADDGTNGSELWKSDGTQTGTTLVADINPNGDSYITYLTNVNGTVFFAASDGTRGTELWKSNGTETGTVIVKDIKSNGGGYYSYAGSYPNDLTDVNGTLFFTADDGHHGRELWKSNGTTSGTVLVKDISSDPYLYPSQLTNVNGTLFFAAGDNTHGIELWKSDGTSTGTTSVKDINPDGSSYPIYLTNVDGSLFFTASDGTHGYELWTSDGTAAGTEMVADTNPSGNSFAGGVHAFHGALYFTADDGTHGAELFKATRTNHAPTDLNISSQSLADGTSAGTEVGTFTSTDPDSGDTFTYRLVSGTGDDDNGSFSITDNVLTITVPVDAGTKSTYSILVSTTDQGGLSVEKQFTFTVHAAPVVTLSSSVQTGRLKHAFVVDSAASLIDPDSPDFTGGSIRVSITSGKQNNELIGLLRKFNSSIGLLRVSNGDIKLGKQVIGHVSGGTNGQDLVITFTSGVTKAVAQDILRAVAFSSRVAGQRTLSFTVKDNTLLSSQTATRDVSV